MKTEIKKIRERILLCRSEANNFRNDGWIMEHYANELRSLWLLLSGVRELVPEEYRVGNTDDRTKQKEEQISD